MRFPWKFHGNSGGLTLTPLGGGGRAWTVSQQDTMTTLAKFLNSRFVAQARKVPKGMEKVEAVMIPMTDDWDDLPQRLQTHKSIVELQCDCFVGLHSEGGVAADARRQSRGGCWKWAQSTCRLARVSCTCAR